MKTLRRVALALSALGGFVLAAWSAVPVPTLPPEAFDAEVHRPPGFDRTPTPATAAPTPSGKLRLIIQEAGAPDAESRLPCRVTVTASDGNCYEPADNPLGPWSLHRLGNRKEKGPFRYYGWFFYTTGECVVAVPPGKTRIDIWRGFEYEPKTIEANILANETTEAQIDLKRPIDMAARGWFSGDTHIHLDRREPLDDQRALDLAAAEDIRFAHILCMNDPRTYAPAMPQQLHPQNRGLGVKSEVYRGIYGIASGQEYRCGTYGHICLVGGSRLVDADGLQTNPNNWPLFGYVADELHGLGGYAFHAHGGYEQEIYADFAQQATDGVELLQFAVYRGIGLEGWYHMLNAGFRFPAVGASDYPYCRALGDCRTYVRLPANAGDRPTFTQWNKAAAEGRSTFTTGPLLELTVSGKHVGDTIELPPGTHEVPIVLELSSPTAPVAEIELIEGGRIREHRTLRPNEARGPFRWETKLSLDRSTWIAARAFAKSPQGREDVEAHTNPVYVTIAGTKAVRGESVQWLLDKLDPLIAAQKARTFEQKEKVVAYYQRSRDILQKLLEAR